MLCYWSGGIFKLGNLISLFNQGAIRFLLLICLTENHAAKSPRVWREKSQKPHDETTSARTNGQQRSEQKVLASHHAPFT